MPRNSLFFSNYLLKAEVHGLHGQGGEAEPGAPALERGNDPGRVVAEQAEPTLSRAPLENCE